MLGLDRHEHARPVCRLFCHIGDRLKRLARSIVFTTRNDIAVASTPMSDPVASICP